ncbi:2-phospho-L-lactate guanylyltransferase [Halomonas sp.]|uniref:2-phospho-L-lactate guanylyltransferase n=1 Tax=Halomonas sp. TaxID=1486246 RepID=UPI00298D9EEB|nr:2-phospho-L-lactate guanylyltransferase [Halomonas sp.]MDW7745632.1 2-phospho-L-lactate guanylyltransferase [Halomonas sp.]
MTEKPLIVIPVKAFSLAKSRLGQKLSPGHRSALARRLCEHTLHFLAKWFPDHDRLVVTASPAIARLARRHGARVLEEPVAEGLSMAAQRAAEWACQQGYQAQLLIPADIVQLDETEIRRLLGAQEQGECAVICPASDGGTNALLTSPPDALPFRFGPRSAEAHREAALRRGLPCQVLELTHLRFDLDTPTDLKTLDALIQHHGGETPQELKKLWNLCMTPCEMTPWAAWLTTP